MTAQHRPSRHENKRQPHRNSTQDKAWGGLIAPPHQYRTIDWMAAQKLFGLHCEHVAIKHRGWLNGNLAQRHRRKFDRKATSLKNTTLNMLDALFEVGMALLGI